ALEHDPAFVVLEHVVLVPGLAVADDDLVAASGHRPTTVVQTVPVNAPAWFGACRYGMFVHANIATVPAFAPVHEYADWYWAFLETRPDMVLHPSCPLPEVVAWHREHARGRAFDEFIPDLTFERFDADDYAQLLDD